MTLVLPRLIRFRAPPAYLGMDRNRFNREVGLYITQIPIGKQGIAFDRLELDAWIQNYRSPNKIYKGQNELFNTLSPHLEKMALFAVNTGCREQEICQLRWEWETKIPESPHLLVFVIPSAQVKNGDDRLVVCNNTASSVIESQRGKHENYVFTYSGKPIAKMNTTAWRNARKKVGLE